MMNPRVERGQIKIFFSAFLPANAGQGVARMGGTVTFSCAPLGSIRRGRHVFLTSTFPVLCPAPSGAGLFHCRARVSFHCAPRIPGDKAARAVLPALGGRAHPCARLGLVTVAPRGPEWTRSRRAAGAGLAGSGVAAGGGSAVLRSSVAVVRAAAFRRVVLRASLRALRRWVAGAEDRCPWCGRASCRPVASPDGSVVFAGCD